MKTPLLCLSLAFFSIQAFAQDYAIGHTTLTFTDASRNNREIPVEIYYPASDSGDDVAVANGQYPVLSFGHGFVMGWDSYENIWEGLVPQGFVMVFPKTETGLLPSHGEFGKDLAFCVAQMQLLGGDVASAFFGRISAASALMGHSMGGGAAFLGMQESPLVTAIAVLAAAETNPSAIAAATTITTPALVIAAGNDCVTPPGENQLPMYEALGSECKTYVNITGGSHCQMSDFNLLCQFGEATCSPDPEITRDEQHAILQSVLVPWLRATLAQDCAAGAAFNNLVEAGEGITSGRNCEQCETLSTPTVTKKAMISPNPASGVVTIEVGEESEIEIYDIQGRRLQSVVVDSSAQIDISSFPNGIYTVRVGSAKAMQYAKLVKN